MTQGGEEIHCPLRVVDALLRQHAASGAGGVGHDACAGHFARCLSDASALAKVPSLNVTDLNQVPPDTLVRFRGLVQDTLDSEIFVSSFSDPSGERHSSLYRDAIPPHCVVDQNGAGGFLERRPVFLSFVPGESEWATRMLSGDPVNAAAPATPASVPTRPKRPRDDDSMDADMDQDTPALDASHGRSVAGRLEEDGAQEGQAATPGEERAGAAATAGTKGLAAPGTRQGQVLAYLYGDEKLRLGDVVEVVGIFTVTPSIGAAYLDPEWREGVAFAEEREAAVPPTSAVPRVHVLFHRRHLAPLALSDAALPRGAGASAAPPTGPASNEAAGVNRDPTAGSASPSVVPWTLSSEQVASARVQVKSVLAAALGGDELSAEYALCHLLTRVHGRHGDMPVGAHTLNILGLPTAKLAQDVPCVSGLGWGAGTPLEGHSLAVTPAAAATHLALSELLPRVLPVGVTLAGLNSGRWGPWKDYERGRVSEGVLRPADGTVVLLDETAMHPGQLNESGVRNMAAIAALAERQIVDYDLQFYQITMPVDAPVLVLSSSKSLAKAHTVVPLPAGSSEPTLQAVRQALSQVDEQLCRRFLAEARELTTQHRMAPGVASHIEADMAQAKSTDSALTAGDLHRWLTLGRALCASHGEAEMTTARWAEIRNLEHRREQRARLM